MPAIATPQGPGFGPPPEVAQNEAASQAAYTAYQLWAAKSDYIETMFGERDQTDPTRLRFLRHRLRDTFSGPISAACGGIAGLLSVVTGFAPIWVAMPLGILIGWLAADRILAAAGK